MCHAACVYHYPVKHLNIAIISASCNSLCFTSDQMPQARGAGTNVSYYVAVFPKGTCWQSKLFFNISYCVSATETSCHVTIILCLWQRNKKGDKRTWTPISNVWIWQCLLVLGFGFERWHAMVWLQTWVSHLGECQIPWILKIQDSLAKSWLYTYTLTHHTDYGGRMSQMEMFSLDGLRMQKSGFYLNYHCRAVKCDNK